MIILIILFAFTINKLCLNQKSKSVSRTVKSKIMICIIVSQLVYVVKCPNKLTGIQNSRSNIE